MSPAEIAGLLVRHRKQKAEMAEIRAEMIKAAMSIGLSQEEAMKEKLETLLDGYLIGVGTNLGHRSRIAKPAAVTGSTT